MKLRFTAILVCAASCIAHPASAGMLNYGCEGELNGTSILFDRMNLAKVADGDISGLSKGDVLNFEADASNDGLRPVMKFGDGTIVLTQKSSNVTPELVLRGCALRTCALGAPSSIALKRF